MSIMSPWLIVGLSGVTNGGKSTVTRQLLDVLPSTTRLLCQDDYFYPEDSPNHIPCSGDLRHHNWDIITSMDMEKMKLDIRNIINSSPLEEKNDHFCSSSHNQRNASINTHRPILLMDGFLLYDDVALTAMSGLRYFFTLTREQCWERRSQRVYEPPDPPGYFNACVWPMYEEHLERVKNVPDMIFLDGMQDHFDAIHQQILEVASLKPLVK